MFPYISYLTETYEFRVVNGSNVGVTTKGLQRVSKLDVEVPVRTLVSYRGRCAYCTHHNSMGFVLTAGSILLRTG